MMTVILRALYEAGFTWNGTVGEVGSHVDAGDFTISYLATIHKDSGTMGEFSGEPGSGWMGSLNDFMVNEGFPGFTVANGLLGNGDEIRVMFTQNLGVDLGGSWGDSNTTLESLTVSTGTLIPGFASGEAGNTYDFALLISGSGASVTVTPHATNINYMVKTFLNEKVTSNTQGNSFYTAIDAVEAQLAALPKSDKNKTADAQVKAAKTQIEAADAAYKALSEEQQGYITVGDAANYNKLVERLAELTKTTAEVIIGSYAAPETKTEAPAAEPEKTETTVVAADGNVTETKTETVETKNLETTVDAEGKTTGSGTVSATTTVTDEDGNVISTAVTEGEITVDTDELGTVSEVTTATTTTTDAEGNETQETTVTTAATTVEGSTGTVVEDGAGKTLSAEVFISQAAQEKAEETGAPVNAPANIDPDSKPVVRIRMERGEDAADETDGEAEKPQRVEVELGVKRGGPGVVAWRVIGLVRELINTCRPGSLIVPVEGDCEIVVGDNTKEFADVKAESWYDYSVKFVTARELFNGNANGTFTPTATMNRAMVAQILYNLYRGEATGENIFSDVEEGKWYYEAVCWAAENGLIDGYADNTIRPKNTATRAEVAAIMQRFIENVK